MKENCSECRYLRTKKQKIPMEHILRTAYGFVGGIIFLFGVFSLYSNQILLGAAAVIIGLAAFYYGFRG